MTLGEYVKKWRIRKNMTQEQFGELVGISQYRVSLIEGDKVNIGCMVIHKLATATGKTDEYLRRLYENNK